jgi:hypothetical protein
LTTAGNLIMTRFVFRSALGRTAILLGVSLAPLALGAQDTPRPNTMPADSTSVDRVSTPLGERPANAATSVGPRLAPAGLTTTAFSTTKAPAPLPDDNANMGPNLALMGAGAAGVVVGLLIGGDGGTAIALGGGVVGLIGLYRYLR